METVQNSWVSVIQAFNPLGIIAEAYAKTLAYKIETKRLEVESTRLIEQASIAHTVIDRNYRLKMEELEQRRIALIGFYQIVNTELKFLHIERAKVLEMAQFAQKQSFREGIAIEERYLFKEMAIDMINSLPIFGEKSSESLQLLVQTLPPVDVSLKLLGR